jgi:hypothetical protein
MSCVGNQEDQENEILGNDAALEEEMKMSQWACNISLIQILSLQNHIIHVAAYPEKECYFIYIAPGHILTCNQIYLQEVSLLKFLKHKILM